MVTLAYEWRDGGETHALRLVPVPGTNGVPYLFGAGPNRRPIEIRPFYLASTPVTQALWTHVMGANPAKQPGNRRPVENVSWDHISGPDGFLDRINAGPVRAAIAGPDRTLAFRLPSETEWEYAARGGPQWRDDFAFSGSNDPDAVAWYGPRWTRAHQMGVRLFGWRIGWHFIGRLAQSRRTTFTHDVGLKAPNQLGLYDMSGNVWEWCEDICAEVDQVPRDGTPWLGAGEDRRLRGGCHHNWDLHCRVWWRYGITPDAHDGCIGFRIVMAPGQKPTPGVDFRT